MLSLSKITIVAQRAIYKLFWGNRYSKKKKKFGKLNRDIKSHNLLKTHMREFICNTARSGKNEVP